MNKIINLTQEELTELKKILRMHLKDEIVILFGSRFIEDYTIKKSIMGQLLKVGE